MSDSVSLTLDELLEEQSKFMVVATVEAITGDLDKVKITPWLSGRGCMCDVAVSVRKNAIDSIKPTQEVHVCCGKTLKVLQIVFKDSDDINIGELFAGLVASMNKIGSGNRPTGTVPSPDSPSRVSGSVLTASPDLGFLNPRNSFCTRELPGCLQRCAYSENYEQCECLCMNSYRLCTGVGRLTQC